MGHMQGIVGHSVYNEFDNSDTFYYTCIWNNFTGYFHTG